MLDWPSHVSMFHTGAHGYNSDWAAHKHSRRPGLQAVHQHHLPGSRHPASLLGPRSSADGRSHRDRRLWNAAERIHLHRHFWPRLCYICLHSLAAPASWRLVILHKAWPPSLWCFHAIVSKHMPDMPRSTGLSHCTHDSFTYTPCLGVLRKDFL